MDSKHKATVVNSKHSKVDNDKANALHQQAVWLFDPHLDLSLALHILIHFLWIWEVHCGVSDVSKEDVVTEESSKDAVTAGVAEFTVALVRVNAVESPEGTRLVVPDLCKVHEEHADRQVY